MVVRNDTLFLEHPFNSSSNLSLSNSISVSNDSNNKISPAITIHTKSICQDNTKDISILSDDSPTSFIHSPQTPTPSFFKPPNAVEKVTNQFQSNVLEINSSIVSSQSTLASLPTEILNHIATFTPRRTLSQAVQVCRRWNEIMSPSLYEHFEITSVDEMDKLYENLLLLPRNHWKRIKSLRMCPNLHYTDNQSSYLRWKTDMTPMLKWMSHLETLTGFIVSLETLQNLSHSSLRHLDVTVSIKREQKDAELDLAMLVDELYSFENLRTLKLRIQGDLIHKNHPWSFSRFDALLESEFDEDEDDSGSDSEDLSDFELEESAASSNTNSDVNVSNVSTQRCCCSAAREVLDTSSSFNSSYSSKASERIKSYSFQNHGAVRWPFLRKLDIILDASCSHSDRRHMASLLDCSTDDSESLDKSLSLKSLEDFTLDLRFPSSTNDPPVASNLLKGFLPGKNAAKGSSQQLRCLMDRPGGTKLLRFELESSLFISSGPVWDTIIHALKNGVEIQLMKGASSMVDRVALMKAADEGNTRIVF